MKAYHCMERKDFENMMRSDDGLLSVGRQWQLFGEEPALKWKGWLDTDVVCVFCASELSDARDFAAEHLTDGVIVELNLAEEELDLVRVDEGYLAVMNEIPQHMIVGLV